MFNGRSGSVWPREVGFDDTRRNVEVSDLRRSLIRLQGRADFGTNTETKKGRADDARPFFGFWGVLVAIFRILKMNVAVHRNRSSTNERVSG
ncbi:hypothetical protein N8A98_02725 [Devosia neptuniae]|uniref:Uncharacterized protein n=1 Tax=Devosia neptuniae TaxID=191302 RepID=A0ABY6CD17_9HYPH|nr:hypothetical protein [Devosia neptuniae]UXN70128.1 hypothetical protein N8A98_02725 [Devosia neptuniae]